RRSSDLDIRVPGEKFRFEKGEQIAWSGNSGSSGGPHLHFEIRETSTEQPLNPLLYGLDIRDEQAPSIFSVMLYPLSDDAHVSGEAHARQIDAVFYDGDYHLKGNPVLNVYGEIGFGIQAVDYLTGSWNKCGVYEINLLYDKHPVYTFRMDRLNFAETRYINSHIDYACYHRFHRRLHKCWLDPGNRLNNYPLLENQGKIRISDGNTHEISFVLKDVYGNTSRLSFRVHSVRKNLPGRKEAGSLLRYNKNFRLEEQGLEAEFRPGTFYTDFHFDFREEAPKDGFYAPLFFLHNEEVPVHQFYRLRIKTTGLPDELTDKALIVSVDSKNGETEAMGGEYRSGCIEARIRRLGCFTVAVDSIAPVIRSLSIQHKTLTGNRGRISFTITDELSGIAFYRGEIDGKWVLFEYDPKNKRLDYLIDKNRLSPGEKHRISLSVSDGRGNTGRYESDFTL
ncbi:MAG: hypothetical protein AB7D05_09225, partial [Mangrovibacterium sp.]